MCGECFRIHAVLSKKRQHDLRAAVILDDAQWDMDFLSIPNVHKMIHDSKIIVAREPNADGTFRAIREPVVAILPQIRFRYSGCPSSEEFRADRKSTRLNSSHSCASRMPSSA